VSQKDSPSYACLPQIRKINEKREKELDWAEENGTRRGMGTDAKQERKTFNIFREKRIFTSPV
jgi:hypothetical protein